MWLKIAIGSWLLAVSFARDKFFVGKEIRKNQKNQAQKNSYFSNKNLRKSTSNKQNQIQNNSLPILPPFSISLP